MTDFMVVKERSKNGITEIYPDFQGGKVKDIMVRGGKFYAIWDEENNIWSTDENDVQRIVDEELWAYVKKRGYSQGFIVGTLKSTSTGYWSIYKKYIRERPDNYKKLDRKVTFTNSKVTKKDYVSKAVDYPLEDGPHEAYEKIISTLYNPEERAKIEWAIGSIVAGDSIDIQKFLVFYGKPGSGKSTILHIIEQLFSNKQQHTSYYTTFEAKALGSNSNQFSAEVFRNGPLVAIQHDGDLSKIEDNTKLNSIISHEKMPLNIKNQNIVTEKMDCMLFMGTNKEVKITDAKSGILRRLIDIHPSGNLIPVSEFRNLVKQIEFEKSGIAWHCLQVYKKMGKDYYLNYRPFDMLYKSNAFYNFVDAKYFNFSQSEYVTLKVAWAMYNEYYDEAALQYKMPMYIFKEELKNYFEEFKDFARIDGRQLRSVYFGFKKSNFAYEQQIASPPQDDTTWLEFIEQESKIDILCKDCAAQYAGSKGTPTRKWANVKTTLKDLDTHKLHYVKVPENHIVIDFDIKGEDGEKNFEENVKAASKFPKTYAELSKSGAGIHLHYIYKGDVSKLSHLYDKDIEVKIFTGDSSLRRMLTKCNNIDISTISSGLPEKETKKVINIEAVRNEQQLRALIEKNLRKEVHDNTTQSINFIYKILEETYDAGVLSYDVRDMQKRVKDFANASSHQADTCFKTYQKMHFCSSDIEEKEKLGHIDEDDIDISKRFVNDTIAIFDIEVKPNLVLIVYKERGADKPVIPIVNPTPEDVAKLIEYKLIGYNNLNYDNHILYGILIGEKPIESFTRSQRIIVHKDKTAKFYRSKYISYCDLYDLSSTKKGLKSWEVDMGWDHKEFPGEWDEPIDEKDIPELIRYCTNDVINTEKLLDYLTADWKARQILSDISGLSMNDKTNDHTAKIIVGNDPKPQTKFVYTDLSEMFPGYLFNEKGIDKEMYPKDEKGKPIFVKGKSWYRGEDPGEGGYVWSEPGIYGNVALLDGESMHPTSAICLNIFGDQYTANFKQIYDIRLAIKHGEFDKVRHMYDGKLAKYLDDKSKAEELAYALKIAINSVYGLTSAKFDNKLRDPRNIDNIVAKRGALFMIDLKHAVQEKGFKVVHIKTDSVKIPDATPAIIQFVKDFGKKYGYNFEHEATYEKMCLVNDAVYIAKYSNSIDINGKKAGQWTATGAQFQHPYVFKKLFSKEPIEFNDMCEKKAVQTTLYLDMNEDLPEGEHNYAFVGKVGSFCPIVPGAGGGILLRANGDKFGAANGSKGFRWLERETVKELHKEKDIDERYFSKLVDASIETISKYGDFYSFASDDPYIVVPKYESPEFIDITSDELPF